MMVWHAVSAREALCLLIATQLVSRGNTYGGTCTEIRTIVFRKGSKSVSFCGAFVSSSISTRGIWWLNCLPWLLDHLSSVAYVDDR
ncbi:hypothetical protein C8Q80DRAFT_503164 [Daedaleopsis nitida]|nr:hypothetical protein C8Q80DRAFT_503164 [Daedaleopsis nitida]